MHFITMSGKYILPIAIVIIAQQFVHCFNEVRFVPGSGDGNSGSIEVLRGDGSLQPICYLGEDYSREAIVICRQMGYVGGFVRYDRDIYITSAFVEILLCTGVEMSISECTIIDHPYTDDCGNITIGAECFNTTGARLIDSDQPNFGRVQVEYNDIWADVCFEGSTDSDGLWDYMNLEVLCSQLGYPGSMLYRSVTFYSTGGTSVDDFKCRGDELLVQDCLPDVPSIHTCKNNEGVIASCAAPGYIGCIIEIDPVDFLLPDNENEDDDHPWWTDGQMTIQKCIDSCRRHDVVMRFAGLKKGNRCFCGIADRYMGLMSTMDHDSTCSTACSGNRFEICGDDNRLSVYDINAGACGDPGNPNNGRQSRMYTHFPFGSVVTFVCFLGYNLVGSESIKCVIGPNNNEPVWNSSIPMCVETTTIIDIAKLPTVPVTTQDGLGPDGFLVNDSATPIGIIAGAAVGGLVVILLALLVLCVITRKMKQSPKASTESDPERSKMNGKPATPDPYYSAVANGNGVPLSTLPRQNNNVTNKMPAYEAPPQEVYDYADVPQETYEEVAQKDVDVSQEEYSEIAMKNNNTPNGIEPASQPFLGTKKLSFPPYSKVNKNRKSTENLYNYADVEVSPQNTTDEANNGNTETGQEGWSDCIIYDDYDNDDSQPAAINEGQGRKGWVDNSIYDA